VSTADDARAELRTAMYRLAAHTAGVDSFETSPVYPGSSLTERRPRPGPAIQASMALFTAAHRQVRDAIQRARTAGRGWPDIAADLAFLGQDPTRDAWRFAAMGVLPRHTPRNDEPYRSSEAPYVTWRCGTCHGLVLEHDPDNGVDAQHGHTPDCDRYLTEKAAERARWDAEDTTDPEGRHP
jgi:type II secretory pathway pseudopilin PulG